ncbi:MAG TPA: PAS domain S-box protein, partial [Sedimentisphaerales bacterium]|nr:PAS domain S-box protein [Sedimentisphaerales bacterium]
KEYCRRYGIKSIIVMPLEVAGSSLGLLSFSCVKAHREWSEELVQRLHLVAQIFANAILRARAEEALRASETRFRSLVRAVPTGIGLISDRVLLEVNDRICEMTGYSRGELIDRNVRLLYPTQKHYDEVGAVAYRQIREHGSGTIETCWRCKDGRIINVVLNGTPLDPNDLSKGYTFAVMDVTERKKAELALQESERRLRTLMANLPGVAYRCANAPGWPFQFVSDGSVALTGYTPQELTNGEVLFGNLIHPDDQQKVWDIVQDAVLRDMSFDLEYRIRVKDGTEKWVFERGRAVFPLQGESSFLEGFIMDITDRKKAMMEAQRHLAELTRAWHANMLGQMATELAHELNQPLCAIVNYSNGCLRLTRRRGYSLETLQDSIERIAVQAQRAADILKRIRGLIAKHDPLRATVDLTGILNDAIQMVKDEAVKNNVAIVSRLQPGLPKVKADRVEIEQVVLNLMRNAIDAMSDPQITQRKLTITSRRVESHKIEISVKDTGRGIPPDLWEKIFEPFFSTKSQGLGVGLSLSQRIVEAHGGRLWGESDSRSGSTFRFTLPVKGAVHGDE